MMMMMMKSVDKLDMYVNKGDSLSKKRKITRGETKGFLK